MLSLFRAWWNRNLSNHEVAILVFVLLFGFTVILTLGSILAPILASIILSYLLLGWVRYLEKIEFSRTAAYILVYLAFLTIFASVFLILMPMVWKQIVGLFSELPTMLQQAKELILQINDEYPNFFTEQQLSTLTASILKDAQSVGKIALTASVSTIPGVITFAIYLILIPMMVFFFLKDTKKITDWCTSFMPKKRSLLNKVWNEVDEQIGNYVRGKVTEILIVGIATYAVFFFFGLKYSILLASLVGISVLVPYIGAIVVTIPVILVAYIQWGWGSDFGYLVVTYLIVQALDGNVLVPLLFSEAVNLHPLAILIAIIIFGAFWGFWGVFFAIPLATLVKAVINAWPTKGNFRYKKNYRNYKGKSKKPVKA